MFEFDWPHCCAVWLSFAAAAAVILAFPFRRFGANFVKFGVARVGY
jgi:hypothetical protein